MTTPTVKLFQAYSPEAFSTRYFPNGNEITFQLEHDDVWPDDKGRDNIFERIEVSVKPTLNSKVNWQSASLVYEYQVAAPWAEKRVAEGEIILGQVHSSRSPLFSLRWNPKAKNENEKLWMDFITEVERTTSTKEYLGALISALPSNKFLSVKITITPLPNNRIELDCNVSGPLGQSANKQVVCDLAKMGIVGQDLRLKFGAYRKKFDQKIWPSMTFTYKDLRVEEVNDGSAEIFKLDEHGLSDLEFNAGRKAVYNPPTGSYKLL